MTYTNATTLVEFLKARYDEDERWVSQDISGGPWTLQGMLDDIETKRRIVEALFTLTLVGIAYPDEAGPEVAEQCLKLLALPYADHPDYDPSWRLAEVTA